MASEYSVSVANKCFRAVLSFLLTACLCLVTPGMAAASTEVFYDKGDAFDYGGGTTRPMEIDGRWAYCAFPPSYSPGAGFYEKMPLSTASGRDAELAAVLWFGWGGPGFDASMWPSSWYDGRSMDALLYAALTHILVTEVFWSNTDTALHECNSSFCSWAMREVFGYDQAGAVVNELATGRVIAARASDVPRGFEAFMINAGTNTQVVVGSAYNPRPDIVIGTVAVDASDGDKYVSADGQASIKDTVSYEWLDPGEDYAICGTLMLKSSGEPLLDSAGCAITASKDFVPEDESGSVDLTFSFDATLLGGQEVVVFESLLHGEEEVASHKDIHDEDQSVRVVKIQTTARDLADGDKYLECGSAVVTDAVAYAGLAPGATYRLEGTLVDAQTGQEVARGMSDGGEGAQEGLTFTAEEGAGTVELSFPFDAAAYAGHRLVALERLYAGADLVASHEDMDDEGQSVRVVEIGTELTDAVDGDHVIEGDAARLVDTVRYSGLVAGESYVVRGTLMQAQTGEPLRDLAGEVVTAQAAFIAQESSGQVEVPFEISLLQQGGGAKLVAFEECLDVSGKVIAGHRDLNDGSQTVTLVRKEAAAPKTGDLLVCAIAPIGALALVCATVFFASRRKIE